MTDYRGPFEAEGIRSYLLTDSRPSVSMLSSQDDVTGVLREVRDTIVLGFFPEGISTDSDEALLEEWQGFQGAADTLRGHASFFAITSPELKKQLGHEEDRVSINIVMENAKDGYGLLPFRGEVSESALSEWVLKNSVPAMGEITFASQTGELFATQFFSAQKLKFILFLRPEDLTGSATDSVLEHWHSVAEVFRKSALFAYMVGNAVPDVSEYFSIDSDSDTPMIVAHEPGKDARYKSGRLSRLDIESLQDFVAGVVGGYIDRIVRSEPVPKSKPSKKTNVIKAVGSTVIDIVSADKDVLLEVYAPWCGNCKRLAPTLDILSKAVQSEDRIAIAKIDGTANDLPPSWRVKAYPTLLYFPKSDKPYNDTPSPRRYWDGGMSLQELMGFLLKYSSFDPKTLRVATSEQLGMLMGDEEALRLEYEAEERWRERNKGRAVFESPLVDYFIGEVVFDGVRWHVLLSAVLLLYSVAVTGYILFFLPSASRIKNRKSSNKKVE